MRKYRFIITSLLLSIITLTAIAAPLVSRAFTFAVEVARAEHLVATSTMARVIS